MLDKQERSIGELVSELTNEIGDLVRHEIALAKVELTQKAKTVSRNVVYLAAGALTGYVAVLTLVATIILALANVMPAWAAALLVTVVVAIVAATLVSKGMTALKRTDLTPRHTVETLKEDLRWAKQQVR
ncbi:MAG: phage holin family protein [Acidobacteriaceae bacterium]|nr:phage holin family protein [Acidobacteriaceae bacterium]